MQIFSTAIVSSAELTLAENVVNILCVIWAMALNLVSSGSTAASNLRPNWLNVIDFAKLMHIINHVTIASVIKNP